MAPTWMSPSQITKYSGRLPIISATGSPFLMPSANAHREYWFMRFSRSRKLKHSRSLTSAVASP